MQVRTGGMAGISDGSDAFATGDDFALFDQDRREMAVPGFDPILVAENERLAVTRFTVCKTTVPLAGAVIGVPRWLAMSRPSCIFQRSVPGSFLTPKPEV